VVAKAAFDHSAGNLIAGHAMRSLRFPQQTALHPYFVDITEDLHIDFGHVVGPLGTYFLPEINGAGGALFDYDEDGDLDLFLRRKRPFARGDRRTTVLGEPLIRPGR